MAGLRKLEYGIPGDNSGLHVRFGIEKRFFSEEGFDLSIRAEELVDLRFLPEALPA